MYCSTLEQIQPEIPKTLQAFLHPQDRVWRKPERCFKEFLGHCEGDSWTILDAPSFLRPNPKRWTRSKLVWRWKSSGEAILGKIRHHSHLGKLEDNKGSRPHCGVHGSFPCSPTSHLNSSVWGSFIMHVLVVSMTLIFILVYIGG